MNEIANISQYNSAMAKSILDKLFFLDMAVDVKSVLDYGCADGNLLSYIKLFCPDMKLFGYDLSEEMVKLAQDKNPDAFISTDFTNTITRMFVQEEGKNHTLLNMSSVIHEMYSYGSAQDIDTFWQRVYESGFEYISIRDMMTSDTANRNTLMRDEMRIRTNKEVAKQLDDFEKIHGSIINNKNMLHFLLKYRYVDNWEREVVENYLPISTGQFFKLMPDTYEVVHYSSYLHPYLSFVVKRDFGIEIADNTHVKILLRRKN